MRTVDLPAIREVADQLDKLGKPYAMTGGVVVGFLLDHPELVDLKTYVSSSMREMLGRAAFLDALPGQLPHDTASQNRLPFLIRRLQSLAALAI